MRSCPYRNDRIINVIRELFFIGVGGRPSFAVCFASHFHVSREEGGEMSEIPISMLALVATAVCQSLNLLAIKSN